MNDEFPTVSWMAPYHIPVGLHSPANPNHLGSMSGGTPVHLYINHFIRHK